MSAISSASATLIEERISWLDAEMEGALASASPDLDLYRWARYHLGWLDERLVPFSDADRRKHGGKRLRGVLSILACEAVGGEGRASAPAGAAIEFIHNFSLVHDDVEDNDEERRHRPTVWKLWGIPHAINAGSNMQAMVDVAALRLAGRYPAETVLRVMSAVTRAIVLMTEGQYLDMAAQDAAEMSEEAYFRMTGGKTAALIEGGLRVGALLGTSDEARVEALAQFGRSFGLAFQCRDDYLGIWGDPALTGKPVGSDIEQGKRSLPVVHALAQAGAAAETGRRLRAALAARDVPAVLAILEDLETAGWVRARVEEHTRAAVDALDRAGVENPHGRAIREIAQYALGRES
ncbi:MAG TPA: polyprenyl synthetase family protein [Armatimonadota bacterium]|nr:polyprenyl synthetase family protein [Armatimonadota bacterium]